MTAGTMKAVRIQRYGGPEALAYEELPKPRPGRGQVLIRNEAAGLNFADIEQRRDNYPVRPALPHILGAEFAGVVEELGDGVDGLTVGQRVFGIIGPALPGAYAQYVVTDHDTVYPLPDDIGFAESTALLIQGLTSYFLLKDGVRLRPGDSLLVLAAAGGLGSLSVQLGRIMKAGKVFGAASTEAKRAWILELGADATIDYTDENWGSAVLDATYGRGVDAALVNVGGSAFDQAIACLAPFGRLSAYGSADQTSPVVDFGAQLQAGRLNANQTLGFFSLYPYQGQGSQALGPALDELTSYVSSGQLTVNIGLQLPLSHAAEAHHLVETRQTTGKVVLLPWAD
ncbi:quinone oxidoreductase family protein [Mycolicibacterium sp. CBM1]